MQIRSYESACLFLYFFSYSATIGCLAVCAVSKIRKGARTLSRFCLWVVASLFFVLFRNVSFFLKEFRGMASIESGLAFYALYILTAAGFLGTLAWASMGYAFHERPLIAKRVTVAAVAIPLAFMPALAILERGTPDYALRLNLINGVMYFSFYAVVAMIVTLAARLSKIPNRFDRLLCKVNVLSSSSYVVLALAQWFFVYRGQPYDINLFSIVNVVLFLMFSTSAFVIGREILAKKDGPPGRGAVVGSCAADVARAEAMGEIPEYPDCGQEESRIIFLISKGATNGEIAEALGINVPRVKNIVHRVFGRFGVKSRTELINLIAKCPSIIGEDVPTERSSVDTIPRVPRDS
ncbi:MAG TPA: helix-turn-helix transcriptional regulator [Treponemataceae bacterium]|nr:helix-turn-helix transcriptional regulator [Treponemataceae bacterium]